jgi:hypothetical protein
VQHEAGDRHAEPERHLLDDAAEARRAPCIGLRNIGVDHRVEARELQRGKDSAHQHDGPDRQVGMPGWNTPYAAIASPANAAL